MESAEIATQFIGTPWTSDEEIYRHVDDLKYRDKKSWKNIRENLISNGLDPDYTDAILDNCKDEQNETNRLRIRGIAEFIGGFGVLIIGLYLMFSETITLTSRGIILWLLAAVGLMVDGSMHFKRE